MKSFTVLSPFVFEVAHVSDFSNFVAMKMTLTKAIYLQLFNCSMRITISIFFYSFITTRFSLIKLWGEPFVAQVGCA